MHRVLTADEHLFALARRGTRLSNVVVAAAAAWAFLFASRLPLLFLQSLAPEALGPTLVPYPAGGSASVSDGLYGALLLDARLWLVFLPLGALAVLWATVVERRPLGSFALPRQGIGRAAAAGALLGIVAVLAICGLAAVFGDVRPSSGGGGVRGLVALGGVLVAVVGWAAQASAEELLSRGWLMTTLGARYTPWFGVVVSSALFASFHALNPGFGWLPAVNLTLIGTFFALFTVWQRCLWGVFALHTAWNWMLGNVLGLTVSGIGVPGGTLLDLDVEGPDWLVGGAFGIEGGAVATVVATAGVLGMVWLLRRRGMKGHMPVVAAGVDAEDDDTQVSSEGR